MEAMTKIFFKRRVSKRMWASNLKRRSARRTRKTKRLTSKIKNQKKSSKEIRTI